MMPGDTPDAPDMRAAVGIKLAVGPAAVVDGPGSTAAAVIEVAHD